MSIRDQRINFFCDAKTKKKEKFRITLACSLDSSLFVLSILLEDVCNMEMKNKKINENIYFSFYNSLSFLGFFLHVNLLFLAILLIIKVKHFVVERFF